MMPPSLKSLQKQCDAFNQRYPVGQRVTVRKDDGTGLSTVTQTEAHVLSGHSAVISVKGISGVYLLARVTPITETQR